MSEKAVLLANRLAEILQKLNTGLSINVKDLAIEFSVSERTIQKDLNERLDPKIIEPLGNGIYRLVPGYLGNITPKDIKDFSQLSGIIDLYPDLDDVLRNRIRDTILVKSSVNKSCIPKASDFKEINYVIINSLLIKFSYNNKQLVSEPYKLLNNSGIWYLLAKSDGVVKSYCVHKMKKVRRDINHFIIDDKLLKDIEDNPSPWFREDKVNIVLKIKSDFAEYFLDRNIISDRDSVITNSDNSLTVKLKVNSIDEIKGLIKYWLPKIIVVEPKTLEDEIKKDLKEYL
ncbi:MAG: WYL domain-containing protein [Spirochaetaceae bacterium]